MFEKKDLLRILHINIQGLHRKQIELEILAHEKRADILCISEHWLSEEEISSSKIYGYNLITNFSRSVYSRGGVCIYVTEQLSARVVESKLSIEKEFEIVSTYVSLKDNEVFVSCIYRPPNGGTVILDKIDTLLGSIPMNTKVIITGDLNIDFLKDGPLQRSVTCQMLEYDLHNKVTLPTRITQFSETSIDVLFTNIVTDYALIENNHLSDHTHQVIDLEISSLKNQTKQLQRLYSAENKSYFKSLVYNDISENNFHQQLIAMGDINSMFNCFHALLIRNFDIAFPAKLYNSRRQNSNHKPWITQKLKDTSILLREMSQVRKQINSPLYNERYNLLKKLYKQEINKAKKCYNDKRITESNNINKTCWEIIREHKNVTRTGKISIVKDGTEVSDLEIQDVFNDFFTNIIEQSPSPQGTYETDNKLLNSFYLTTVTPTEIEEAITKCCKKKSSGVDNIPGMILLEIKELISVPLCTIVNKSFESGVYPINLKVSKIIPIFKKKGDERDLNNYRPIAVQCQISKIFEYCFHTRLYSFFEKFNVLSPSQHGYRKLRSTVSALESIIDCIYDALNQKDKVLSLFFDMSRAFDSVDHRLLAQKLYDLGIRGGAHKWIVSYLTSREQIVCINGIKSRKRCITRGVPQGTILGPLLFSVMINDLPSSCSAATDVSIYADDTNLTVTHTDLRQLLKITELAIQEMQQWCNINGIQLNIGKTQMIQYYPMNEHIDEHILIRIDHKSVPQVENVKVLGLYIDCKLTWNTHVQWICKKVSAVVYMFRTLRLTVSKPVLIRMYFGLFQSILQYGLILWGNSSHADTVFKIQKKVIRIIEGVHPRTSCAPLFKKLKVMTLYSLYMYNLVINIKRNSEIRKNSDYHTYHTRNKNLLRPDFQRLAVCQNRIDHIGARCFNKLPAHIQRCTDFKSFRKLCYNFFVSEPYYSVNEFLNRM